MTGWHRDRFLNGAPMLASYAPYDFKKALIKLTQDGKYYFVALPSGLDIYDAQILPNLLLLVSYKPKFMPAFSIV